MTAFSLEALGGPWGKRLATRRGAIDELDWASVATEASPTLVAAARDMWTRSAFSEYASGAAFAQIASCLLTARAPIDLIAAAGDFVADEMFHAELASRVAMALGGATPMQVDFDRLAKPSSRSTPVMRAAELIVRTCCVGEALTVPILDQSRRAAGSPTVHAVISRILRDEAQHAELGWWFLDWADLSGDDRAELGREAGAALRDLSTLFDAECSRATGLGTLDCARFDGTFLEAVERSVVRPLAARGIVVPAQDIEHVKRQVAPDLTERVFG